MSSRRRRDTAQGWWAQGALAGRQGLALGQLKNLNPVRPMSHDTLFLEYASGAKGRWQDPSGKRIRAEVRVRSLAGQETRPMGYFLRTADGQLLRLAPAPQPGPSRSSTWPALIPRRPGSIR